MERHRTKGGVKAKQTRKELTVERAPDVPADIATSVDWSNTGIFRSQVGDQGALNTCWAFAMAALVEGLYNKNSAEDDKVELSVQELINCVPSNEDGLLKSLKTVVKWIGDHGILKESECLFVGRKDRRYRMKTHRKNAISPKHHLQVVDNMDEDQLIRLVSEGPVVGAIWGDVEFSSIKGDVIYKGHNVSESDMLHNVLIVGFGSQRTNECTEHYWIVRNSYGKNWGTNGYGKIIRKCSRKAGGSLFVKVCYCSVEFFLVSSIHFQNVEHALDDSMVESLVLYKAVNFYDCNWPLQVKLYAIVPDRFDGLRCFLCIGLLIPVLLQITSLCFTLLCVLSLFCALSVFSSLASKFVSYFCASYLDYKKLCKFMFLKST